MPIEQFEFPNGQIGPRIFCDGCGEAINDPQEGIVAWTPSEAARHAIRFACKDACLRQLDRQHGRQHTQPINAWFVYLLRNARIDLKDGKNTAEILSSL